VAAGGFSPASLSAVGPQLQAVGAASTTAAAALGEAIAGVEMPAALEHARTAATVLSDATSELSERDLSQTAHGRELLRLHTLVLGLQAFAGEIERTVRRIEHPEQAITPDERVRLPAAVTTATPNVKTWWRRARP
jgi:hypothetical protein